MIELRDAGQNVWFWLPALPRCFLQELRVVSLPSRGRLLSAALGCPTLTKLRCLAWL